jgi:hypothetical protein
MEVHFTPETGKKLNDLAARNGRANADELVQSVIEGYFNELAETHEMLIRRYDELKIGRVSLVPDEEVETFFREKSAAARRPQRGS